MVTDPILSIFSGPVGIGDGPKLCMRPMDWAGVLRFYPTDEVARIGGHPLGVPWFREELLDGVQILDTPYIAYVIPTDPAGSLRLRLRLADIEN